mmetsp:Transcript_49519/g.57140  ORF Transcript_49519/g.57140 Transcript_49519/m.57140 type:complete len:92 (+) Transcript_49519:43-318(+)
MVSVRKMELPFSHKVYGMILMDIVSIMEGDAFMEGVPEHMKTRQHHYIAIHRLVIHRDRVFVHNDSDLPFHLLTIHYNDHQPLVESLGNQR